MRDRAALQFNITGVGSDELQAYLKEASTHKAPGESVAAPKARKYKKNKPGDVIEYTPEQEELLATRLENCPAMFNLQNEEYHDK